MLNLLELFLTFFKIGLFTFGGGYAMIPLIREEVLSKGWVLESEILDFIAISESTPGPFAVNIATFIGYNQEGVLGAIFATLGVIIPSLIIIIIIAKIFNSFSKNKYVKGFFIGARPVIVGVIIAVAIDFILSNVFYVKEIKEISNIVFDWKNIVLFVIVLTVSRIKKRVHPVIVVLTAALLGYILFSLI